MSHTPGELAGSLKRLIYEAKVVIPFGMARIAVEIEEWLDDVIEAEASRVSGGQNKGDPRISGADLTDAGTPLDQDD